MISTFGFFVRVSLFSANTPSLATRLKQLQEDIHTQKDAEAAVGLSTDNVGFEPRDDSETMDGVQTTT